MSNQTVISVENVGKAYRINHQVERQRYVALRDVVASKFKGLLRTGNPHPDKSRSQEDFWALKNVDFQVKQGEVLGILGRNGAGKSTLLKILSRITEPSQGRVRIKGRVASLLEVGTGFHPELTGRENVFLNGAILGMSRAEVKSKFDEIVAFAEVEKFLDTAVKFYSSGMYVRLAFAVAAHLEPEILIVDEVLAVGDSSFQKKCLGRMGEVSRSGRTVLFVSHQLPAILALTTRCILLSKGLCVAEGETPDVADKYLRPSAPRGSTYSAKGSESIPSLIDARVITSLESGTHEFGSAIKFTFRIKCPFAVKDGSFSFQILDRLHNPILHFLLLDSEAPLMREPGVHELVCTVPKLRLYIGAYTVTTHIAGPPNGAHYETIKEICPFEVISNQWRDHYWRPGTSTYVEDGTWQVVHPESNGQGCE